METIIALLIIIIVINLITIINVITLTKQKSKKTTNVKEQDILTLLNIIRTSTSISGTTRDIISVLKNSPPKDINNYYFTIENYKFWIANERYGFCGYKDNVILALSTFEKDILYKLIKYIISVNSKNEVIENIENTIKNHQ